LLKSTLKILASFVIFKEPPRKNNRPNWRKFAQSGHPGLNSPIFVLAKFQPNVTKSIGQQGDPILRKLSILGKQLFAIDRFF
jgi:hypothetical protein